MPKVATAVQHYLIDTFTIIASKCTRNKSLCCNYHLIYLLLDIIPLFSTESQYILQCKVISLVELLGAHSTNVRELKKLFKLLKTETGDFRPAASPLLLKAMQNMALSRGPGPEVFFDFIGNKSVFIFIYFYKKYLFILYL